MRPAVRNFEPDRLREAREVRGLAQPALAEMVGVTRQAISQYELGRSYPSPEILTAIAECLRFPEHRFVRVAPEQSSTPLFFRSMASASKSARTRAHRKFNWLVQDVCKLLDEYVVFPEVNFPNLNTPSDPTALCADDIEAAATETRRHFGIGDGPISDIVLLLENHGAVIVRQELSANKLDAFSAIIDHRPYIVLGSDKASAVRSRFDAAHELAHIVLHSKLERNQVHKPEINKLLEKQAHYFAGAFLMPKSVFNREFPGPSLDELVVLKRRWRVSVAAMIRRAFNLQLISDYEYKRMNANRMRRWRRNWEPLDDELAFEQPRFISRSFDLLLDNGLVSRASIEAETGIFVQDIELAAGLEPGFFGDSIQHYKFPQLKITEPQLPRDTHTPCLPFTNRHHMTKNFGLLSERYPDALEQ